MEDGEERNTTPGIVIALVLTIAAAIALMPRADDGILQYAYAGEKVKALGVLLGYAVAPVLALWLVLHFAYVRWRAPSRGFFYFMLMFVAASAVELGGLALRTGALGPMSTSGTSQATLPPELVMQMEIANTRTNIATALRPRGGRLYFSNAAQGPAAELDSQVKTLADGLGLAGSTSLHQLDALDYPAFMLPQEFKDAAGLARARTRLATARDIVQKEQAEVQRLTGLYRSWIATRSPLTQRQRKMALASLDDAVKDGGVVRARYDELALAQIAEFEALIHDMRNTRQPWQFLNGKIYFADPHDLAMFRRHGQNIETIEHEAHAVYMSGGE